MLLTKAVEAAQAPAIATLEQVANPAHAVPAVEIPTPPPMPETIRGDQKTLRRATTAHQSVGGPTMWAIPIPAVHHLMANPIRRVVNLPLGTAALQVTMILRLILPRTVPS